MARIIVQTQTNPTAIVQNLSIVTARVDEVIFKSETDYQIKATVLVVEQNDDIQALLLPGKNICLHLILDMIMINL